MSSRRLSLASLLLPLVTSFAGAQAPAPWSSLTVPGGVVAQSIGNLGKLVTYHDNGTLNVWSAVTRRWYSMSASSSATMRVYNDLLFVQDGSTWTAFSSWFGRFAPIVVSPAATVVNFASSANDSAVLVVDNGQLHAFSAFVGVWTQRPFPATATASVQRHVALFADGAGVLGGYDAYTGQWLDLAVSAQVTSLSTDGTAGLATGGGLAFGFSASERTWRTSVLPDGATLVRGDDFGVWYSAARTLGYSALRSAFAWAPHGATLSVHGPDTSYALLETPLGLVAFSAFTATFSHPLVPTGAVVTSAGSVALLGDAAGLHAYSAVLGSTALRPNSTGAGVANLVGWTRDIGHGRPSFFSALTGAWHEAPATALAVDPTLTTTCACALTNAGCVAFSGRTGSFAPLNDPTVLPNGNTSSAPLIAVGASQLYAFDARVEHWRGIARAAAGPVQLLIWRTSVAAIDGNTAFAFGAQSGSWSSQPLPGPMQGFRANSESVRLHTANEVFAWSAMSESAWLGQYPEFRRVQTFTTPLRAWLLVPPGGFGVAVLAPVAPAPITLPSLGDLWLQPAALTLQAVPPSPAGEGVMITWPAVIMPAKLGVELGMQALMLPAVGQPWLTDLATVRSM
ncbi:MAG TPA: hypothetical protein VF384_03280 [Planctomycetota bacterium]